MEKAKIANFENSYKINEHSYHDDFFCSGDQDKNKIYISENELRVSGT